MNTRRSIVAGVTVVVLVLVTVVAVRTLVKSSSPLTPSAATVFKKTNDVHYLGVQSWNE